MILSHLLSSILILTCLAHAVPSIRYQQYGPAIISSAGIAAVAPLSAATPSPVSSTAPVIKMGIALARSGLASTISYADNGIDDMLCVLVDYVNSYGGVWMNGTQYQISVYVADHQSSTELTQLIYADMATTQGIELLLGPYGEQLQSSISPFLEDLNTTLVSAVAFDPSSFPASSTNVYGLFPSAQYYHINSLNTINANAAAYFYESRSGSRYGITSACLYGFNDSLSTQLRAGVLDWIHTENTDRLSRGATSSKDLIKVVLDSVLDINTSTASNYLSYWLMCPEDIDLVVMPVSANAIASLALSQRRFKAVLSLDRGDEFFAAPSSVIADAVGWTISVHFLGASEARARSRQTVLTLPSLDIGLMMYAAYASAVPSMVPVVELSIYAVARVAELVTMMAALNASLSANRHDLREAFMSLNNVVGVLGPMEFNTTTGLNNGDGHGNSVALQCRSDPRASNNMTRNSQILMYDTTLSYPFDWSWRANQPGDRLVLKQGLVPTFIAWITAFLGVWLSQILLEHALFVRRPAQSHRQLISVSSTSKQSKYDIEYILWLTLSAQSLGGIGIAASQLFQSTSLTTHLNADSPAQDLSWSPVISFLSWLVAIVLTFAAIVIMVETHIHKPRDKSAPARLRSTTEVSMSSMTSAGRSAIRPSQPQLRSQTDMSRRREQLEARPSNQHLTNTTYWQEICGIIEAMKHWRIALASLCMVSAVTVSRYIIIQSLQQHGNAHYSTWSWPATLLLDWALIPFCFTGFKYSIKLRIPCVILFVLAIGGDWQLSIQSIFFTYDPSLVFQYTWVTVRVLSILTGTAAVIVFLLFIGLQLNRTRLSHKDLLLLIRTQEKALSDGMTRERVLNGRLVDCEDRVSALLAALDCITLVSSAPFHFVLPLALFNNLVRTTEPADDSKPHHMKSYTSMENIEIPDPMLKTEPSSLASSGVISTVMNAVALQLSTSLGRSMKIKPVIDKSSITTKSSFHDSSHNLLDEAAEDAILEAIESQIEEQSRIRVPFELTSSLLGAELVPRVRLELVDLLEHPVCVEIFKQTLNQYHSLENLTFYLIARKYRTLTDNRLRRLVALQIVDHFIREGSQQQINLSTCHRRSILDVCSSSTGTSLRSLGQLPLIRRNEQAEMFNINLFLDAEREVLMLMESNMFARFEKTPSYRLCCWLSGALNTQQISSSWMMRKSEGTKI